MSYINPEFKSFVEERMKGLVKASEYSDKRISSVLLYVTSGALALSLTFILSTRISLHFSFLLICAWLILIASIVTNVFGYYLSRERTENLFNQINNAHGAKNDIFDADKYNLIIRSSKNQKSRQILVILNKVELFLFCFGILFLTLFIVINVVIMGYVFY